MQPPDPIPTPRAWPIVCVMSASHSHPSPQGDSHQGPYGKDWEESCDRSFLLSPNRSNTSGRTTVPAELCAHVWVCRGAHVPVCVNWGSMFVCKCLSHSACVCMRYRKSGCKYLREIYKDCCVWRNEGRRLDIEHVAVWEKWSWLWV